MAKFTVYVPDELRQRIQALGDALNLSQLFRTALEGELRRTARHREIADLDASIDITMLRQRFAGERAQHYRQGYQLGLKATADLPFATLRYYESIGWDPERI